MQSISCTPIQARRFLLYKQGLLGEHRFEGKKGVIDYVRQAGCIQFDPIDVCGKNAELVLQSRVKGFQKQTLYNLLYEDRKLLDYFDKNLSIMLTEDWPYFSRIRKENTDSGRSYNEVNQVAEEIKYLIKESGPVSSKDIDYNETVKWYWSDTRLSRAALETLYFRGDLIIHHKNGSMKYYDLAENCIPSELLNTPDPYQDDFDHMKWRVLRRIGSVGLLWNKSSDAWLGLNLKAPEREKIFEALLNEGKIAEVSVEGLKDKLYCLTEDIKSFEHVMQEESIKRCEFIAPLDNMMWDRKLIKALFDFNYKWEIYTPEPNREYGYYVLPILYGDTFIGRIEMVNDQKNSILQVKNMWFEPNAGHAKGLWDEYRNTIERFAEFHDCKKIQYDE
ncbi:MAG TPA: winged helix-turn-helix domain-containing protein [Clostridiales bacterium]|nr:winged helix-turn-helix domain-containing protein [Clostridiales bacterium]